MGKQLTADICRTLLSNMRKCEETSPLSIREGYFKQALERSLKSFEREAEENRIYWQGIEKSDSTLKNPVKK